MTSCTGILVNKESTSYETCSSFSSNEGFSLTYKAKVSVSSILYPF